MSLRIFEQELESWDRIEESWPKDRSFAAFRQWFDYSIHWMVFDITHQQVELEETNNHLEPFRVFGHIWTHPGLQENFYDVTERRLRAYIRPRIEGIPPRALMESALPPLNTTSAFDGPVQKQVRKELVC